MQLRLAPFVFAFCLLIAWPSPLLAQCATQWVPHPASIPGTNGSVFVSIAWDPDGAGPAPLAIVVGGTFTMVGTVPAANVAAWNPVTGAWSALGSGTNGAVRAFTVLANGEFVAGGDFTTAGGGGANRIARWNGTTWSALGQGTDATVQALATLANGDLVAGGTFASAGGIAAFRIATWNLSSGWSAGPGPGFNGPVHALLRLGNGDLLAGGEFTNQVGGGGGGNTLRRLARWDGTAWNRLGPTGGNNGANDIVRAVADLPNGDLVVTGDFTIAGNVAAAHVARWNGTTWANLGTGLGSSGYCLAVLGNGDLVVGGDFTTAGGVLAVRLARWNGATWAAFAPPCNARVATLRELASGEVLVGGDFTVAAGVEASHLAAWSGALATWRTLALNGGPDGPVTDLALLPNGDIVAAGAFTTIGDVVCNGIARWDGSAWHPLGSGLYGAGDAALLVLPNGDLVVGGMFSQAGGVPAVRIARWDGVAWSAMPGMDDTWGGVDALALGPGGTIVAGGSFMLVGGTAFYIAQWDGTSWSPLGFGTDGPVTALATGANGEVVVAGLFSTAGVLPTGNLAHWNGSSWSGWGLATGAVVWSVAVRPDNTSLGEPVIGGDFTTILGQPANRVARIVGTGAYNPMGAGIAGGSFFSTVLALCVLPDGDVFVGGKFTLAGGLPAANIARWSGGSSWSSIGSGTDGTVYAITRKANGDLMVCGDFKNVDGLHSPGFATLTTPCPAIAQTLAPGCSSSGGTNTLVADTLPFVDGTFRATATGLPPIAIVLTVTSVTSFVPGVPLSLAFAQAGPGCDLFVAPDILGVLVTTTGTATSQFVLPNTPPLVGVTFFHQMVPIELDALGAWVAVTATNALQLTAGQF